MEQEETKSTAILLETFTRIEQEIYTLRSIINLLDWDEKINIPKKGFDERAEQLTYMSLKLHDLMTSEKLVNTLRSLYEMANHKDLSEFDKARLELFDHDLKIELKVPKEYIETLSKMLPPAHNAWINAREKESYSIFAPWLSKIFELKRLESRYIDPNAEPYDVMLDIYERGLKSADLDIIFPKLASRLSAMIKAIQVSPNYEKINSKRLIHFEESTAHKQIEIAKQAAEYILVDKGRFILSETIHPFMTSLGPNDLRISTSLRDDPTYSLFSTAHEAGHALYEADLDPKTWHTIVATDLGLALHESQSRFWENMIFKGKAFWRGYYKMYQAEFSALKNITLDDFYRMINIAEPSEVRIEADELTYALHIVIRYEIEKGVLSGKLDTSRLEDIWNSKYQEFLGLTPSKPSRGIVQDVHWSDGLVGYFPTYALGSIYSVMIYNAIKRAYPDIEQDIERLDFSRIRNWLKENIHKYGASRSTSRIIKDACGKDIDVEEYIDYLKKKYYDIYGIME